MSIFVGKNNLIFVDCTKTHSKNTEMDGSFRVWAAFAAVCTHQSYCGAGENQVVCGAESQR